MERPIGSRATWYPHLLNLRAALERRDKFIESDNALKAVMRMHRPTAIVEYIERIREEHSIPPEEVYGNVG